MLRSKKMCPYCGSLIHFLKSPNGLYCPDCPKGRRFIIPQAYVDEYSAFPPEVLHFVGDRGHGKTTTLMSMFYTLDSSDVRLNDKWPAYFCYPRNTLSRWYVDRAKEIYQARKLPRPQIAEKLRRPVNLKLVDIPEGFNCTLLAFDSAGEDYKTPGRIQKTLPMVRTARNAVFMLSIPSIEVTTSFASPADELKSLLWNYIEAMRGLGADTKKQRLLVTYTMADDMQEWFSGEWSDLREAIEEKGTIEYFIEQDGDEYMAEIRELSLRLCDFTWTRLNAQQFLVMALRHFKSVDFSMVSALGRRPLVEESNSGGKRTRKVTLDGKVSPRRILDPLLMTIDKSHTPLSLKMHDIRQMAKAKTREAGSKYVSLITDILSKVAIAR